MRALDNLTGSMLLRIVACVRASNIIAAYAICTRCICMKLRCVKLILEEYIPREERSIRPIVGYTTYKGSSERCFVSLKRYGGTKSEIKYRMRGSIKYKCLLEC